MPINATADTKRDGQRHPASVGGLKAELVLANQILLRYAIVDAFGHVSARHPHDPSRFFMARRIPPGLVGLDDIREFGLDGELIDRDGTEVYSERFIHSAILAERSDVHAVVHSHSPNIVAFGVVPQNPLRPICHTCGFLGDATPVFEIRDAAREATNLMIISRQLGTSLVKALGGGSVVLMRGHGSTVVGSTLPQAVYRAVYTETNARIQTAASTLGTPIFLTRGEALAAEEGSLLQVERAWQLWKDEARSARTRHSTPAASNSSKRPHS